MADAGGGSVVVYRHLKRLKQEGFDIVIVVMRKGLDRYDDEFQYYFLEKKWWYPFIRKNTPYLTDIAALTYLSALSKMINFDAKKDTTLGLLGEFPNLLLLKLFEKKGVPYCLFFHDDYVFNQYWHENIFSLKQINSILLKSSFIFSVSQQMVNLLKTRGINQSNVLYPIAESHSGPVKKTNGVNQTHLKFGYAGTLWPNHEDILNNICTAMMQIDAELHCITGEVNFRLNHPKAAVIKNWLSTREELFEYLYETIDVLIVFYSFDPELEPRMQSSFPSKFIEYAQLEIPIAIIAPAFSTLGTWALKNNWMSYIDSDAPLDIAAKLNNFKDMDYWQKCQLQVIEYKNTTFNPDHIHHIFKTTIMNLAPAIS